MPNTQSPQVPSSQVKRGFDALLFLGEPGAGKTIERYARNQKIFETKKNMRGPGAARIGAPSYPVIRKVNPSRAPWRGARG